MPAPLLPVADLLHTMAKRPPLLTPRTPHCQKINGCSAPLLFPSVAVTWPPARAFVASSAATWTAHPTILQTDARVPFVHAILPVFADHVITTRIAAHSRLV